MDNEFTAALDPDNPDGDFFGEVPGQLSLDLGPAFAGLDQERREQLAAALDERRKANVDKYKDMLALKAQPDPMGVIMMRINLLLDTVMGEDTVRRLEFENEFETDIGDMLDECLQQARQRALTQGINPYRMPTMPPV